jgi:Prp8 binding protein
MSYLGSSTKDLTSTFTTDFPVLAIAAPSLDYSGNPQVFTAGIDDEITCWDVQQESKLYAMKGHTDAVTSLAIHPQQQMQLLSNSMDHT